MARIVMACIVMAQPRTVGRLWGHLAQDPPRHLVAAEEWPGTLGGGLDAAGLMWGNLFRDPLRRLVVAEERSGRY